MVRKRMMHPQFFSSADLANLSFRANLTFAGLWIYCDDSGRGEDDARFIMHTVYPRRDDVTHEDVAEDLKALESYDMICRYTVGGGQFFHVPSWFDWQKVSHPTPSRIPPCEGCYPSLFREWWKDCDTATDKYRRAERRKRRQATDAPPTHGNAATREDGA